MWVLEQLVLLHGGTCLMKTVHKCLFISWWVAKHCSSLLVVSLYLPQQSPVRRMSFFLLHFNMLLIFPAVKHNNVWWSQHCTEIVWLHTRWEQGQGSTAVPPSDRSSIKPGHRGPDDILLTRKILLVFLYRATSCSVLRITQCSWTSTVRCLNPATLRPWPCLCWSLSKCSTLSTGQLFSVVISG